MGRKPRGGTENNRGKAYFPGDGGFIASFSDGTVTNKSWQAQTFYTAPIYNLRCLSEVGSKRLSKTCDTKGYDNGKNAFAVHWSIPPGWNSENFQADWPSATEYSENEIGVDNKRAYTNFRQVFSGAGAKFIWSTNVVLDNEVLLQYKVE